MKRIITFILSVWMLTGCTAFASQSLSTAEIKEQFAMQNYSLSNPNADEKTKAVYDYICSLSGNHTLSAQQESTWMGSVDYEMNYIQE